MLAKPTFSETANGYPRIDIEGDLEPFAEFLRSAHSIGSAGRISEGAARIVAGEEEEQRHDQDYAFLILDRRVAEVAIDDYGEGSLRKAIMPIDEFAKLSRDWLVFLRNRGGKSN